MPDGVGTTSCQSHEVPLSVLLYISLERISFSRDYRPLGNDGHCALDHRSKLYRKNAADSLMLSQEALTQESHEYWLTMAEFWLKLAQYVEESKDVGSAIHRSAYATKAESQDMRKSK
jgi:hypothetical protein